MAWLSPRTIRIAGWVAIAIILAATVHGILVHRGLGLDFANFYDAGRKARAGEFGGLYDPFATIAGEPPFSNMTFFSLPLTSYFYWPLAWMGPAKAATVFKIFSAVSVFAGLGLLYRHYQPFVRQDDRERALYFALFWIAAMFFQPFWSVFQIGGQTTPFLFLLFVLGLLSFEREQYVTTAMLMALAVCIKPAFGPGAALLFLFAPARFRVTALISAAVVLALSVLILGWSPHQAFLELMREESSKVPQPIYNSNMFAWVEPLLLPSDFYTSEKPMPLSLRLLTITLRLAVIALLALGAFRLRRAAGDTRAARNHIFVVCMLASLVYSPVVWTHYLMMLFIPVVHFIAFRHLFPPIAWGVIATALFFAPIQNLLVLRQILKLPVVDATWFPLTVAGARSLTMLLLIAGIILFRHAWMASYRDKSWQ